MHADGTTLPPSGRRENREFAQEILGLARRAGFGATSLPETVRPLSKKAILNRAGPANAERSLAKSRGGPSGFERLAVPCRGAAGLR